jgi:hypothetical protein
VLRKSVEGVRFIPETATERVAAASMAGALLEPGARRLPGATCQHRDHDLCLPIGAIRTAATPTPSTPHRCHTCAVPDGVGDGPSDHEW